MNVVEVGNSHSKRLELLIKLRKLVGRAGYRPRPIPNDVTSGDLRFCTRRPLRNVIVYLKNFPEVRSMRAAFYVGSTTMKTGPQAAIEPTKGEVQIKVARAGVEANPNVTTRAISIGQAVP